MCGWFQRALGGERATMRDLAGEGSSRLSSIMLDSAKLGIDPRTLREEVSKVYSRVAADPDGDFRFHRGSLYAVELLGYDPVELAALPSDCTASFAGIANPHAIAPISPRET